MRLARGNHRQAARSVIARWVAATLTSGALSGCMFGGGPLVGVRLGHSHAVVAGVEVGAGVGPARLSGGMQTPGTSYLRLDAMLDYLGFGSSPDRGVGGTLGAGYGGGDGARGGGVFAAGLDVGAVLRDAACSDRMVVGHVGVDLRYVRGWEVVLRPRIEAHADMCTH